MSSADLPSSRAFQDSTRTCLLVAHNRLYFLMNLIAYSSGGQNVVLPQNSRR